MQDTEWVRAVKAWTPAKAPKQEPCDVTLSRQDVLAALRNNYREGGRDIDGDYIEGNYSKKLYDTIISLPPVTPQPIIANWIFDECKEHGYCSHCGYGSVDLADGKPHNYCTNCGCKMVESQEHVKR